MYATGSFGVSQALVGVGFLLPLSVGVPTEDRFRAYVPHTAFDRFVELLLVAVVVGLLLDGLQSIVEVTRVFSR